MHQDLDDQDIKAEILRTINKTIKYGTYCLVETQKKGRICLEVVKMSVNHGSARNITA